MKIITRLIGVMTVFILLSISTFGQSTRDIQEKQIQLLSQDLSKDTSYNTSDVMSQKQSDIILPDIATSNKSKGVLWDNGPIITHPGAGSNNSDYSLLQDTSQGLYNFGFGMKKGNTYMNNTIADDFVVTEDWLVSTITFYGYQTNYGPPSTIREFFYRIYDGDPSTGGSVIYGDIAADRFLTSQWINAWRVKESDIVEDRPIMEIVVDATGLTLSPGTYWIEWQAAGSGSSGPWAPSITILGQADTGNALQFNLQAGWFPMEDLDHPQGLPFIIEGIAGTQPADDLIAAQIISPTSGFGLGIEPVTIKIYNYGTNDQSNFEVAYSINGGTLVVETLTATVPANGSIDYTFSTPVDLSILGEFGIEACPMLTGDENPGNDCANKTVTNYHGATVYPQLADYWSGSTNATSKTEISLAHAVGDNIERGWIKYDISSIPTEATILNVIFCGYIYETNWPEWSITALTNDPVTSSASDIWNEIANGSAQGIAYSYSNESISFTFGWHEYILGNTAIADFTAAMSQGWFAVGTYNWAGNQYFPVKIHGWNETNLPYLIVDYEVSNSVDDSLLNQLTIFPNPTEDTVNVNSDIVIKSISIYNQTGQLIVTKQTNAKQINLDLTHYNQGIYFLRLGTEKGMMSEKIIIQ